MEHDSEDPQMPIGAQVDAGGMLVIGQEIRAITVRGSMRVEQRYQFRLELVPVAIASSASEPGLPRWTEWMTVQQTDFETLLEQWLSFLHTDGHLAATAPPGSSVN